MKKKQPKVMAKKIGRNKRKNKRFNRLYIFQREGCTLPLRRRYPPSQHGDTHGLRLIRGCSPPCAELAELRISSQAAAIKGGSNEHVG